MDILRVEGLRVRSRSRDSLVLKDVSFVLKSGEILGFLGESGSGKSLTALSMVGLLPKGLEVASGEIIYGGKNLLSLSAKDWQTIRGKEIAIILQDPLVSLNPVMTIGEQMVEVLREHLGLTKRESWSRAVELLSEVGIPEPELRLKSYPHELSGGMRQRAMIAMAISCSPKVLIADEPTTALDPTLQFQVLTLLKDLNRERGLSIIFITHDLGVMRYIAKRVCVFYQGEVVEIAETERLFNQPVHPYSLSLLASYPGSPFAQSQRP